MEPRHEAAVRVGPDAASGVVDLRDDLLDGSRDLLGNQAADRAHRAPDVGCGRAVCRVAADRGVDALVVHPVDGAVGVVDLPLRLAVRRVAVNVRARLLRHQRGAVPDVVVALGVGQAGVLYDGGAVLVDQRGAVPRVDVSLRVCQLGVVDVHAAVLVEHRRPVERGDRRYHLVGVAVAALRQRRQVLAADAVQLLDGDASLGERLAEAGDVDVHGREHLAEVHPVQRVADTCRALGGLPLRVVHADAPFGELANDGCGGSVVRECKLLQLLARQLAEVLGRCPEVAHRVLQLAEAVSPNVLLEDRRDGPLEAVAPLVEGVCTLARGLGGVAHRVADAVEAVSRVVDVALQLCDLLVHLLGGHAVAVLCARGVCEPGSELRLGLLDALVPVDDGIGVGTLGLGLLAEHLGVVLRERVHLDLALLRLDQLVDRRVQVLDLAALVRVLPRHHVCGGDAGAELLVHEPERPLEAPLAVGAEVRLPRKAADDVLSRGQLADLLLRSGRVRVHRVDGRCGRCVEVVDGDVRICRLLGHVAERSAVRGQPHGVGGGLVQPLGRLLGVLGLGDVVGDRAREQPNRYSSNGERDSDGADAPAEDRRRLCGEPRALLELAEAASDIGDDPACALEPREASYRRKDLRPHLRQRGDDLDDGGHRARHGGRHRLEHARDRLVGALHDADYVLGAYRVEDGRKALHDGVLEVAEAGGYALRAELGLLGERREAVSALLVQAHQRVAEVVHGHVAVLQRLVQVVGALALPQHALRHLVELAGHRGLDASPVLQLRLALGEHLAELLERRLLHLRAGTAREQRVVEREHDVGGLAHILHGGHDLLNAGGHGVQARGQPRQVVAHLLDGACRVVGAVAERLHDAGEVLHRVDAADGGVHRVGDHPSGLAERLREQVAYEAALDRRGERLLRARAERADRLLVVGGIGGYLDYDLAVGHLDTSNPAVAGGLLLCPSRQHHCHLPLAERASLLLAEPAVPEVRRPNAYRLHYLRTVT